MGRPRKWGVFTIKETLDTAFNNALGDLNCLYDEVSEWKAGMEGTGLEETGKFQMLEEAEYALENAMNVEDNQLQELELLTDALETELHVCEIRKSHLARHHRLSNAINELEAVKDCVEGILEEAQLSLEDLNDKEFEALELKIEEAEGFVQELDDLVSEMEGVEFPGMYS